MPDKKQKHGRESEVRFILVRYADIRFWRCSFEKEIFRFCK